MAYLRLGVSDMALNRFQEFLWGLITLLRRLHQTPNATNDLVAMRADLLELPPRHPELETLDRGGPAGIGEILENEAGAEADFTTAVFYSISNCQPGLKRISFGNFLTTRHGPKPTTSNTSAKEKCGSATA